MSFMFEKLEVYQKAVDFADQIAKLTEEFALNFKQDVTYFIEKQGAAISNFKKPWLCSDSAGNRP